MQKNEICKKISKKYAINMQKYASICRVVSAAEICKNMQIICNAYAQRCKICDHKLHMQKMQKYAFPTLLMLRKRKSGKWSFEIFIFWL